MISTYFVLFIIYSFFGWIYETCFCTIHEKVWRNRGFLYGPCIPIYGVGATLAQMLFVDCPRLNQSSNLTIFLGCAVGSFILEYATSYFLEKKFHARWWDYSKMPLNIKGRVCLIFTCCFGIAGILVTKYLVPPVVSVVDMLPMFVIELLALIFMFMFGMDMALTVSALTSFAKEFERINEMLNNQMAERVEAISTNLADAKIATIEKINETKEALRHEHSSEDRHNLLEQLSTEYVKQWISHASSPQKGQFRHIAKFTHPVDSTKTLLDKGSEFLRNKGDKKDS